MWNKLTPHELNIIFTNGPIEMLDRAWKKLDRGDVKYLMTSNLENGTLIEWDPFFLKDENKRTYHNYFPSLVEMKSGEFRVIAFKPPLHNRKQDPGRWFAMPSLNFLPIGINKVIAGDGGLLVCDGAMQWIAMFQENGQLPPIATQPPLIKGGRIVPMDPTNWTKKSYLPGQTILLVCNPTTREYMFLPPFKCFMTLNAKAACIRFVEFAKLVATPNNPTLDEKMELSLDVNNPNLVDDHISKDINAQSLNEIMQATFLTKSKNYINSTTNYDQPSQLATINQSTSKIRIPNIHPSLKNNLDELDYELLDSKPEALPIISLKHMSYNQHASKDIHTNPKVEGVIEAHFQQIWKLYFECFGYYPIAIPPPSRHYIIAIVGYQKEITLNDVEAKDEDHLVCAVYKSTSQGDWYFNRIVPSCMTITMPNIDGQTSLAMLTSVNNHDWIALCFGGFIIGDKENILNDKEYDLNSTDFIKNNTNNASQKSTNFNINNSSSKMIGNRLLTPSIFYMSMVGKEGVCDVALAFPFHPQGYENNEVQCPIVLQPFGVKSPEIIVVLSRRPFMANTMTIFQLEMSHDYGTGYPKPNGSFLWMTEMPTSIYRELFNCPSSSSGVSNKSFQSSAGEGLICIKSIDGQKLAIYDMYTTRWWLEDYQQYYLPSCLKKDQPYQLMEIVSWEPNFRQKVEYDFRYEGGKPNLIPETIINPLDLTPN
ncbi:unnamed protein product [Sphagnum troendelagicum]|uniref:Uncharacterized protein n=1 Tax=Sphagnum troendelagicum TaxID=128251 RepID=A0ABP0U5K7_9BRYO